MTQREPLGEGRPEPINHEELRAKLVHLSAQLEASKSRGILFTQEGAMRWLTGIRQQISDIAADAESPVQALVRRKGDRLDLSFLTTPIEMPRIKDQIPPVFLGLPGVDVELQTSLPSLSSDILAPDSRRYTEVMGRIVRPLCGGFSGNQYAKLSWLSAATTAILAATVRELEPGMNGAEVRAIGLSNLFRNDIDCNQLLVALGGQEGHFHPLWDSRYRIEKDCWIKLVAGARYADMIVSATLMSKFGSPPSDEALAWYGALQEGVVEYSDCFRNGAPEAALYKEIGRRFAAIEKGHGIAGFAASAYAHHLGGPTSPLANRDYLITRDGTRSLLPWTQFAVNPVEIRFNTKVEVQGTVQPYGAPHMLDHSLLTPPELLTFRDVSSANGTRAKVADILVR